MAVSDLGFDANNPLLGRNGEDGTEELRWGTGKGVAIAGLMAMRPALEKATLRHACFVDFCRNAYCRIQVKFIIMRLRLFKSLHH